MTGTDLCVNKPHCTAAAQCGLFTYKSVPVIFEPLCILSYPSRSIDYVCICLTGVEEALKWVAVPYNTTANQIPKAATAL